MKRYNDDYFKLDVGDILIIGDLAYSTDALPEECSVISKGSIYNDSRVEERTTDYDGAMFGITCAYRSINHPTVIDFLLTEVENYNE